MLADLDDVLAAVQAAVRDDLWPETSSPWAARQARTVLWALEHVRVRLARGRELMIEEHEQLSALLTAVEARAEQADGVLAAVERPKLSGRPPDEMLDPQLTGEVAALAQAAERLAELTPELDRADLAGLRAQLMQYLTDHDRRLDSVIVLDYTC